MSMIELPVTLFKFLIAGAIQPLVRPDDLGHQVRRAPLEGLYGKSWGRGCL